MRLVIRLLINAAALWVAVRLAPGITYRGGPGGLIGVALVFGLVNALVRPVLMVLSFPFLIITLGIFTLIVNGLLLWLTSALAGALGLGFHVAGFWAAFWGALVISLVSFALSLLLRDVRREVRGDRGAGPRRA